MGDSQEQITGQQTAADDVLAEYLQRVDEGESVDREAFIAAHPEAAAALKSYFAGADAVERVAGPVIGETTTGAVADNDTAVPTASQPDAGGTRGSIPKEFGRYRVVRTLGHGAMGSVYLAEDTQLDRQVALKVPKFAESEREELLLRFNREAKAAATLSHPNVCPVFDVGEIDGTHFISMGYIEGRPLSDFINPQKPQPERLVAAIIRKLALAMDEAHQRGIVHRDIKPANIMIDQRNEPIIMDFGLARSITGPDKERVTHDGTIVGTPAYMPPEQVKGEIDQIGPAADIYSLGVVMHELLTGQLPFNGSVTEVIARVLRDPTPRATSIRKDLDSRIDDLCFKMMSKGIGDRYPSMSEVADALSQYLNSSKSKASKAAPPKQPATSAATPNVPLKPDSEESPAKTAGEFDPYHKWLGIPPKEQPPNHYRLLAIELFEADLDVIEAAAVGRSTYVRQCATGPHANASQEVLNNLSEAEICLLNPEQKAAYDAKLKAELDAKAKQEAVKEQPAAPSDAASSETVATGKKAEGPTDPKLAQLTQKLDKQKKQIESLLEKCEFASAISALEKMAAVKNPKVAKYVKWAKLQLPKAKRGTQEMRESSAAMLRTAADLYERHDYEEAAEILQQVPQKYRDAETRELLQECLDTQEEVVILQDDIDRAESLGKYEDLQPTVERLLEIKPNDRRARRLIKELKAYGKGGRMRLGSRDGRFDAAGNTSNPWKVALAFIIPLVLFGVVGYATVVYIRSNNKTIKIEIDDPTAKVIIDGEAVEITGIGDTIKLKVGKHDLVVERDDLVVHTRNFEVVKGKNSVLQITLLGADGNPISPTVAASGGAHTIANALPITIVAKEERGYPIGPVKSGTELQIQYVSGLWKGWGSRADISPDNTTGRGGDACFLAIVDFPQGAGSTAKVLKFVPEGTAQKPFTYVLPQDAENLVLRINDRGDGWAGNPGSVQYKVLVGGKSLGGATAPTLAGVGGTYDALDLEYQYKLGTFDIGNDMFTDRPGRATIKMSPSVEFLKGRHFTLLGAHAGSNWIRFKVKTPTTVHLAVEVSAYDNPNDPAYPGYVKIKKLQDLLDNGWKSIGTFSNYYTDEVTQDFQVYSRECQTGDAYALRNHKYSPAIVFATGNSIRPSVPQAPANIKFTQLTPAEAEEMVDVVGTKPVPLALGTPDGKGWHDIPGFLRGACIFNDRQKGQGRAGFADFTAKKATDVYLACSWAYEGNRSGGWFEQRVTDQQLQQQGWEKVGHMYASVHTRYRIFKRRLSQGEKFEIRTNKYSSPFVIVASADPGPTTTAVRLAPDPGAPILIPGKKATPLKDIQGVSGIPPMLQDATAYTGGAATYFTVGRDQTVYIAASWAEAGNRQGQWVEDQWKADKFQAEGWKDVGKIMFSAGKDEHTLFSRDCKKGETFWIRTRKRAGPVLIVTAAAPSAAATPAGYLPGLIARIYYAQPYRNPNVGETHLVSIIERSEEVLPRRGGGPDAGWIRDRAIEEYQKDVSKLTSIQYVATGYIVLNADTNVKCMFQNCRCEVDGKVVNNTGSTTVKNFDLPLTKGAHTIKLWRSDHGQNGPHFTIADPVSGKSLLFHSQSDLQKELARTIDINARKLHSRLVTRTGSGTASAPPDVSKLPMICQLLQSKRAPQQLIPQAVKFAAPDGDGRRGANGFLLDAPAGWETNGTTWSCDFARDGASRGVVFIHPYNNGHVMVVAAAGGLHVGSPGTWPNDRNASLYGPRYKGFALNTSPEFKQVFQLGDQSHQLISKLAADGSYEFLLDGKVVATTQVTTVLPLKFTDAITLSKPPTTGTAGAIIGPTDQGSARASNVRFGTLSAE